MRIPEEMKFYWRNKQYLNLIKKIIKSISRKFDRLMLNLLRRIPVDNQLMILQSDGDFWDNTRVFYDYLIENHFNNNHRIIWLVKNPKLYSAPYNVKFLKRESLFPIFLTDYYLSKAKCVIYTHSIPNPSLKKFWKDEQIFINVSHSASQLKKIETDVNEYSDYRLCCGEDGLMKRSKAWNYSRDHFPIVGMPRLDLLFKHKECLPLLIDNYQGEKLILSMETFKVGVRHNDSKDSKDVYAINVVHSLDELVQLDNFLDAHHTIMIVKIHHMQVLDFLNFVKLKRIRFFTDQDLINKNVQLYELIENADYMLTDYSSVFYDYLLLDRPVGFLIGDMEQYSRGFITDDPISEMPGKIIKSLPELLDFLSNSFNGQDDYKEERKKVRDLVFTYQDGKNCERLLNWLQSNNFID